MSLKLTLPAGMLDVESICLFWKPAMIRFGGVGIVEPPSCIESLGIWEFPRYAG